jgi:hypothetical protein
MTRTFDYTQLEGVQSKVRVKELMWLLDKSSQLE